MSLRGLRIGVIGGSIAGTAVAVLLTRSSQDVTVFERSSRLDERGGGIGLEFAGIRKLEALDLIDRDMPQVRAPNRIWRVKDGEQYLGRLLKRQQMNVAAVHWGLLHHQLLARMNSKDYRSGVPVDRVENTSAGPSVLTADGTRHSFDIVVGADGYRSRTRQSLFPAIMQTYAGYPAWRGIVDERELPDAAPVDQAMHIVGTTYGHAPFYLVPGRGGETQRGTRRLNWLWYDAGVPDDVLELVRSADGHAHVDAVPPGDMTKKQRNYLREISGEQLPPWHRDVVRATPAPYIQSLYDLPLDHYVAGRVCLAGDAAAIARPHTGSATLKALEDAIALAQAVDEEASIEAALARYDVQRGSVGQQLVRVGQELGREQVVEAPRWAGLNEAKFDKWFGSGVTSTAWYAQPLHLQERAPVKP